MCILSRSALKKILLQDRNHLIHIAYCLVKPRSGVKLVFDDKNWIIREILEELDEIKAEFPGKILRTKQQLVVIKDLVSSSQAGLDRIQISGAQERQAVWAFIIETIGITHILADDGLIGDNRCESISFLEGDGL